MRARRSTPRAGEEEVRGGERFVALEAGKIFEIFFLDKRQTTNNTTGQEASARLYRYRHHGIDTLGQCARVQQLHVAK